MIARLFLVSLALASCAAPRPPAASYVVVEAPAPVCGADEAVNDISAGKLVLLNAGLGNYSPDYAQKLQEKLGVEIRTIGNCSDWRSVAYVAAYNTVMKSEIEKRFGLGILEKLKAD
jgi:hypothetical protein